MYGERHQLTHEFPELQHTIHQLKIQDHDFASLLKEYEHTDKTIHVLEKQQQPTTDARMTGLKVKRLNLKDQLYSELKQYHS
ncbi:MAG: DUF465 domain-containing protein [Thiotrichaceae bacterium]|nr:DUF465 domain-containing protein [Thiotrichaceae bacterium]